MNEITRETPKSCQRGGAPRDEKMCHVPTGALLNPWSPTQCYDLDPGDRRMGGFFNSKLDYGELKTSGEGPTPNVFVL